MRLHGIFTVSVLATLPQAVSGQDGTTLAATYTAQVDRRLDVPVEEQLYYAEILLNTDAPHLHEGPGQYVILVDRSPQVQALMLFWRSPEGTYSWIGASPVSTGKPGRYEYFKTPLGVFEHSIDNLDYRAEGTRNEFGIRGYGRSGLRVFDFGWIKAIRGWGDHHEGVMRLQMHATDPDVLEPRLGNALSKGCIRIPASLNVFLDHYGVLDAAYEDALSGGRRLYMLLKDREPVAWPGRYLVIVDSERKERPAWAAGGSKLE